MATFRSKKKGRSKKESTRPRTVARDAMDEDPPFVPDFALLDALKAQPTADELAAIAMTLWHLTASAPHADTAWEIRGRIEALRTRL